MDDPVAEEIMAEFPGWRVWYGVSCWYARRLGSSPPIVLRAGNLDVLRAKIALRVGPQ